MIVDNRRFLSEESSTIRCSRISDAPIINGYIRVSFVRKIEWKLLVSLNLLVFSSYLRFQKLSSDDKLNLLDFSCRKVISQVITGYLPSLILLLFLKVVPPIMWYLSSIQGHISNSQIERSSCDKVLWFTIWNVFFGNVLSGSVLTQISILLEPKSIPGKLALTVPAQVRTFHPYNKRNTFL